MTPKKIHLLHAASKDMAGEDVDVDCDGIEILDAMPLPRHRLGPGTWLVVASKEDAQSILKQLSVTLSPFQQKADILLAEIDLPTTCHAVRGGLGLVQFLQTHM